MKEQAQKFTSIQLNDATLKLKLYLNKITDQQNEQRSLQKLSNLAIENFLKFVDSEEFVRHNYGVLKSSIFEKKSFYVLYIVDTLIKNNKYFMGLVKRDLDAMFKVVWQKCYFEPKNEYKLDCLRSMVKTWGVIFQKKTGLQQILKKWLQEKYDENLNLSGKSKLLFEQQYQKMKNQNDSKLSVLLNELAKEEPRKIAMNSFLQLKQQIFQD